jgi:hypothetical protein
MWCSAVAAVAVAQLQTVQGCYATSFDCAQFIRSIQATRTWRVVARTAVAALIGLPAELLSRCCFVEADDPDDILRLGHSSAFSLCSSKRWLLCGNALLNFTSDLKLKGGKSHASD